MSRTKYERAKWMDSQSPRHTLALSIWLGYVIFVVYGSLVPLDFQPLPIDRAWSSFQHIPMHKLGVESRADWISNGVLYVPIGFLTAYLLIQTISGTRRLPVFILTGLFSLALAISVEFAQIFFPPRSVSLNDLLAESVGSFVGLMLAVRYSDWFKILLHAIFSNPRRLTLRLIEAYFAGYMAFSLFPYDILLSGTELQQKILGNNWGWLIVGDPQGRFLIIMKSLTEIILTIPFGLFLGYRSARQSATYRLAIILGISLGGFIEIAQLFTATGVSQGLSVLTRIAGVCSGLALWNHRATWSPERLAALARRFIFPVCVIYLLLLLQVNGWFSHNWNGADFAASQLRELHFLPFYYHYYTTEAKALFSLASVCFMYLPIGLLTWSNHASPAKAFFYAFFTASVIETGKLFLQGVHPDPTNIMLGALASWSMVHLAQEFSNAATTTSANEMVVSQALPDPSSAQASRHIPAPEKVSRNLWVSYAVLVPTLAFAAYWAATFPTQPVLLCLFLMICAVTLWCRPVLLVAIIPAALPILDLTPWSGRFYLDEFDLLLLISLAIGYTRVPIIPSQKRQKDTLFSLASALIAISFTIGAIRGLFPWQTPDANSFTNHFSQFNALRVGKGALWAFLCYGLLRRFVAAKIDVKRPIAFGMTSGLALTVLAIIWERITFSHLFDFASDYRVTGPFSSMHMGGAYIECFLAAATPFLLLLVIQTKSWISRVLGVFLLLATTYALMVTFSRSGYAAFGVALACMLLFATFRSGRWQQRGALVAALIGVTLAVAIPVFTGAFAQDRIATISKDYGIRQAHWKDALSMRTPDSLTTLFGMGLGRYPESHYLLSREGSHAGTYQLKSDDKDTYLRLGSGEPIYVEQIISIEPNQDYVLKLDVRSSKPGQKMAISICEKWMLTSFNCIRKSIILGNEDGFWNNLEESFSSASMANDPWYARKLVKFALHNPPSGFLEIKNVRLETTQGENLLLNSTFSKEMDHWFFSADNHLQWHVKSLPIAILFDQGWFGLIAVCAFSIVALRRAAGRAWRGDLNAAAALAAFGSFLVVGLFDTLIDAPRFLLLFLLLGWFSGFRDATEIKNHEEQQHG